MAKKSKNKTSKAADSKAANNSPNKAKKKKAIKAFTWPSLEEYIIPNKLLLISGIVALGLAFLIYGQSLSYDFVLDDVIVVSENSFVKKGFGGITELLTTESFVGYFGEQKDLIPGARYRPLSIISFAVEYEIFGGLNSRMNHLFNILLYGLCGWLLFVFLAKIFPIKNKWWVSIPFLALVIWILHPVHTEAVANIKGRDEILSLIFGVLTLLASIRFYEKAKFNVGAFSAMIICFFLGLLSKENTITFLAVIPATLYFFRAFDAKKFWIVFGSLVGAFILYLCLRVYSVGYIISNSEVADLMNNPFVGMTYMERMATVFYTLLKYVGLSFVPYPLTHDYYPFQIPRVSWLNGVVVLSVIVHVAMGIYTALNFKKRKPLAYLFFFYIATLSISSNFIFNVGTTMNERFLFAPTVATSVMLVLAIRWLIDKLKISSLAIPILVGLVSIAYFAISFTRVPVWESALSLNTSAVEVSTNSARANTFMATALYNKARELPGGQEKISVLQNASKYANKAVKLYPKYNNANLMKAGIAGELHKLNQDYDALYKTFMEVARNRPDIEFIHEYLEYLQNRSFDKEKMIVFFYMTGYNELILKQKDYAWGLKYLNYAYELRENDPQITFAISEGYKKLGNQSQSDLFLARTLQLDPSFQNR